MDPLFDRLGRLIRSWGTESPRRSTPSSDPFEREAEDELEAFLRGARPSQETRSESAKASSQRSSEEPRVQLDPKIVKAYQTLGLSPDADWETVVSAHRRLLKDHHPDRHAGDDQRIKAATARSQEINEAFQLVKRQRGR